MSKKIFVLCLVCLLLVTSFVGCAGKEVSQDGSSEDPIKIGIALPRSGAIALLGSHAFDGAEIAREMINERGGVNGREVIFAEADAPGATEASTEANRLIDQQGVNVIIGSLSSGNALAISSVTERNNSILWETSGISDDITESGGRYIFRTCESGSLRGYYGMQFIAEELSKQLDIPYADLRISVINEDSSFGESILKGILEGAEDFKLNIVSHDRYNKDVKDLSSLVVRVKENNPDVIFAVSYVNDAVLLYDTLKQFDVVPKALVGGGAGYTDLNFADAFGEETNGIFVIDMPTNIPSEAFANDITREIQTEFRERFLDSHSDVESVPLTAEVLFAGTWVLLNDVLPNAKSMNVDDIAEAAREINLDETTMGWGVKFNEKGQNEIAIPAISQWQNGSTIAIWPEAYKRSEIEFLPLNK